MALPLAQSLRVGAQSHCGKVRSENQDLMSRFTSPFGEVFIVADGMGGHQGGQTAVLMTVEGFDTYLRNAASQGSVVEALKCAAQSTNERIYELANSNDPNTAKMGSTVVLAVINENHMWVGHAGDSRAYLYRNRKLIRLTKDHSMVQKMIDHDMLTEEQARNHPDASVINRAFGQQPELELEVSDPIEMLPDDGILLCTDGLSGYVADEEISTAIERREDAQEITAALIDLALAAGGEDNVTVQYLLFQPTGSQAQALIETNPRPEPSPEISIRTKSPNRGLRWIIVLLLFGMFLGFALGWVVFVGMPIIMARWQKEEPQAAASPSPSPKPSKAEASPSPEPPKETQEQSNQSTPATGSAPVAQPADPEPQDKKEETSSTPSPIPSPTSTQGSRSTPRKGRETVKG